MRDAQLAFVRLAALDCVDCFVEPLVLVCWTVLQLSRLLYLYIYMYIYTYLAVNQRLYILRLFPLKYTIFHNGKTVWLEQYWAGERSFNTYIHYLYNCLIKIL